MVGLCRFYYKQLDCKCHKGMQDGTKIFKILAMQRFDAILVKTYTWDLYMTILKLEDFMVYLRN